MLSQEQKTLFDAALEVSMDDDREHARCEWVVDEVVVFTHALDPFAQTVDLDWKRLYILLSRSAFKAAFSSAFSARNFAVSDAG